MSLVPFSLEVANNTEGPLDLSCLTKIAVVATKGVTECFCSGIIPKETSALVLIVVFVDVAE